MNSSRINAKRAKNLSEKIQQDTLHKNLRARAFQAKFKKIFQKLTIAAINHEIFFEFSDKDSDFLKFCLAEFIKLDFFVEVRCTTSDKVIQGKKSEIETLRSNIHSIAELASTKIEGLVDDLCEFSANKSWLVRVYDWLPGLQSHRPLLKPDWHLSVFESLQLVKNAERDQLFLTKQNNFKEQGKLRSFILSIKEIHQSASENIDELKNKIYLIENNLIQVDKDFRTLRTEENIDDYKILSMRLTWQQAKASFLSEDSGSRFLSPGTLLWFNSTTGKEFLDFIENRIILMSNQGKQELIIELINDSGDFFLLNDEIELASPSPRAFEKIYSLLGFKVKKLKEKHISDDADQTLTEIRLSW
jgi:hypothetical protein